MNPSKHLNRLLLYPSLVVSLGLASLQAQEAGEHEQAHQTRNVAILIYPGVELLDFAGPGEVFAAAGPEFNVFTVAESTAAVRSMGFLDVTPEYALDACPEPDIVVVPGGNIPAGNARLQAWVREQAQESDVLMSVCNGASLLARAGLLANLEIATHRSNQSNVSIEEPTATVLENRRFVDHGKIMTTAGISAGIDGSLHLVARFLGDERALRTARYMEYDWRPEEIAAQHAEPGKVHTSPELELLDSLREHGFEKTLAALHAGASASEASTSENALDETRLNRLGYQLLQNDHGQKAVQVLELQVAAYPDSANPYDSLSEAHERLGNPEQALAYAELALAKLESDEAIDEAWRARVHEAASSRIERLRAPAARFVYSCPPCGEPCDDTELEQPGTCSGCGMTLTQKRVAAPAPSGSE